MSVLNQEELFGKLIPTVYIDRITLETTGENPVKQDNPHIDTGAEGELIEDKFRQKAELTPNYLKSSVELSLKEVLDDDLIGRWFDEEKIRKYIKIWLVQSKDPTVSFVLSENTSAIQITQPTFQWSLDNPSVRRLSELWKISSVERIRNKFAKSTNVRKIDLEFDVEGSAEDLTAKYSELDDNGNTIVDVCFRTNFLIREENPAHLSYFVVSYLDIESIREDFEISFNEGTTILQNGEVSSEVVIDNNEVAGFSFVLLTPDGRPWAGAVHRRPDGSLATYSTEQPTSQPLTSQRVVNSKIQDFRDVRDIERLQIDLSVIEQELQPVTNKLLGLKRDNMIREKKKSYFSELYLSRSRAGAAKFAFALDYQKLLKDTSVYKKLFDLASKKNKEDLLSFGRIRFMKVVRRRVLKVDTKNSLGNPVNGEIVFNPDDSYKIIAVANQGQDGTVSTSNTVVGGVRELDVSLQSEQQGIRFFTAEDRSMIDVTDGVYQYGIELEIEDATDKYLKELASNLRQELRDLNKYYEDGTKLGMTRYILDIQNPHIDSTWERFAIFSSNAGAYEPTSNRFTQAFITQQRRRWQGENKRNSPWRRSVAEYLKAINVLTPFVKVYDVSKISQELLKMVAPETGNPRGVLTVISLIDKLATNLENLTSSAGSSDRNDSNPRGYSRTGSKSSNRTSKIMHWFTEENFDSDVQKNYGYDYLSQVEGDKPQELLVKARELSDPGLRVIAGGEYQRRVEIETLKYFNSLEPQIDLKKGNKLITSGDTIDATSFSFLSPSFCYLGDDVRELVREETDTASTERLHEDGFYSLIEAKASLFNTRNAPIAKRSAGDDEKLNQNVQEYRDTMIEYFSSLGMTVEPVDQQEYIPQSDSDVSPVRTVFAEDSRGFDLNVIDDRDIDNLDDRRVDPNKRTSLDRINPNSIFLGISKPYIQSGYTNESSRPSQKNIILRRVVKSAGDAATVDTIETYDLNKRENFVNRAAQTPEAKNDLAKSLGFESGEQKSLNEILKRLPNQIKSLLLDSVNSSQVKNSMIGLEYDPVSDTRTSTYFDINYSFINRIEVVVGYVENEMRLKDPIWKPLTLDLWNNSAGSSLICRMRKFELPIAGIKHPKGINLPVYDIYFVLVPPVPQTLGTPPSEETPMPQNLLMPPIIQVDDDKELIIPEIDDSIESLPKYQVIKNNIVGTSPEPVFCLPFRKSLGGK